MRLLSDRGGFTLVELMVVIVILGILAAIVGQKVMKNPDKARVKAARIQIEILGAALDQFALDTGSYPTTSQGLQALIRNPGIDNWDGPYLDKPRVPDDPWGVPYHYQSPGSHGDYDLYSYGKDKSEGGEGYNRDIVSWE